jgi:hypothetical protein
MIKIKAIYYPKSIRIIIILDLLLTTKLTFVIDVVQVLFMSAYIIQFLKKQHL